MDDRVYFLAGQRDSLFVAGVFHVVAYDFCHNEHARYRS